MHGTLLFAIVGSLIFVQNLRDGSGRDEPGKERAYFCDGVSLRLAHCAPFGALRLSARLIPNRASHPESKSSSRIGIGSSCIVHNMDRLSSHNNTRPEEPRNGTCPCHRVHMLRGASRQRRCCNIAIGAHVRSESREEGGAIREHRDGRKEEHGAS